MAPSLIVMAVLLFAAATPVAHGQAAVTGQLCCTSTGNCPGGPGIPGETVSLNCTNPLGSTTTMAQATTGDDGAFTIDFPYIDFPATGMVCDAVVELPLNQTECPPLETIDGILMGSVTELLTLSPFVTVAA